MLRRRPGAETLAGLLVGALVATGCTLPSAMRELSLHAPAEPTAVTATPALPAGTILSETKHGCPHTTQITLTEDGVLESSSSLHEGRVVVGPELMKRIEALRTRARPVRMGTRRSRYTLLFDGQGVEDLDRDVATLAGDLLSLNYYVTRARTCDLIAFGRLSVSTTRSVASLEVAEVLRSKASPLAARRHIPITYFPKPSAPAEVGTGEIWCVTDEARSGRPGFTADALALTVAEIDTYLFGG